MKVLRLYGERDLQLSDEPRPEIRAGEVLLKVEAVGICGSDLHWFEDSGIGDDRLTRPLVLGHEFAGLVVEGPHAGRRVAVDPAIHCGKCSFCESGNPNFCADLRFAGHGENDGALRGFMAWPARMVHPLPEGFSAADGVMLEPLGVALHALDLAHLRPGVSVAVLGCGPIGLLLIQLARLSGATEILATDPLLHRRQKALEMGADTCIDSRDDLQFRDLVGRLRLGGVDVAFEVAGQNDAVEAALEAIRPGGKVILVGIPGEDTTSFSASLARRKGVSVKLVRRMKHTYPRAIELVKKGCIDVRSLVTHQFPIAQYEEAFTIAAERRGLKVLVEP
ncbi:MAG: alcohol dehydrogenase catalytic domain-containing protein [Acidobacteriota bacterium]|nr:MAG: alcohol dehydrogenase catalytic domain-containing protein [Acidobacteriota bacterium]